MAFGWLPQAVPVTSEGSSNIEAKVVTPPGASRSDCQQPFRAGPEDPYTPGMSVTFDLPPETLRRLEAEATRRGVTVAVVIAELAEALPNDAERSGRRPAFVAAGASGHGITHLMDEMLDEGFGRD
jgi:hypothetical protein